MSLFQECHLRSISKKYSVLRTETLADKPQRISLVNLPLWPILSAMKDDTQIQ